MHEVASEHVMSSVFKSLYIVVILLVTQLHVEEIIHGKPWCRKRLVGVKVDLKIVANR